MLIRNAEKNDFPQMLDNGLKFVERSIYTSIGYDRDSFLTAIYAMYDCGLLIVAEEDGIHLGGVGGISGPFFINESTQVGTERFWYVLPDSRGAGVAKLLLKAIEDRAREIGCKHWIMIAQVNDDLPFVEGAYLKSGYRPFERTYMKVL